MTLFFTPNVWASDSEDTDCKDCGLRWFAECVKCKKITCTWCGFAAKEKEPGPPFHLVGPGHVCKDCQSSEIKRKGEA